MGVLQDRHGAEPDLTTTVLRVAGRVKGASGCASVADAAAAVMAHSRRTPEYLEAIPEHEVSVDLRPVGDTESGLDWAAALSILNSGAARFRDARLNHISVFAFTYVPLLVALGSILDDVTAIDVYDRHRTTESWAWNEKADPVPFHSTVDQEGAVGHDEAVLIVNASGTISTPELPSELQDLPRFTIAPAGAINPSTSTFENADTLAMFDAAVRGFFADLEVHHKQIGRLHVFAAVPVSAAITLGRRRPANTAAPAVAVYHRTGGSYLHVVEIPTTTPPHHVQEVRA
ncbi:MAG: SAVED domain-containing protein [Microthrixaceae bacterium]